MRAEVLLRVAPHYRLDAFCDGLTAAGYRVGPIAQPIRDDVLCIWNRYGRFDERARQFEAAGARVLVTENGYLGADENGLQLFALALRAHNGNGGWRIGGEDRWHDLGMQLAPWRTEGRHILVAAQRGIGSATMAQPVGWHDHAAAWLRQQTKRPVVIRQHPAVAPGQPPIEEQLAGCHAVVTWASAAACKALVAGVPVFYGAPSFVAAAACKRGIKDIEAPFLGDRMPGLTALAWAQWRLAELSDGTAFRWLLRC